MLETQVDIKGQFPDSPAIERDLQSPELLANVGDAVAKVLQGHVRALNAERTHGYGGAGGFYENAARSTGYTTDFGFPAVVVMKVGVALRRYGTAMLEGGMLRPKNAKYLAIPNSFSGVIAEVYGHSPREFENLRVVFGRRSDGTVGPIALAADEGGARNKGRGGKQVRAKLTEAERGAAANVGRTSKSSEGEIMFWLKKEVYQRPDYSVLPEQETLEQAGRDAAIEWLLPRVPTAINLN